MSLDLLLRYCIRKWISGAPVALVVFQLCCFFVVVFQRRLVKRCHWWCFSDLAFKPCWLTVPVWIRCGILELRLTLSNGVHLLWSWRFWTKEMRFRQRKPHTHRLLLVMKVGYSLKLMASVGPGTSLPFNERLRVKIVPRHLSPTHFTHNFSLTPLDQQHFAVGDCTWNFFFKPKGYSLPVLFLWMTSSLFSRWMHVFPD